jgi:hypothetical protein
MKKLIILFVLILLGSLGSQRYDLSEWYRVYKTQGYMDPDSNHYVELDLRLYPPEYLFYDDTTMSECPWKLCVWFNQKEKSVLGGVRWVLEYTETYGRWIYLSPGRMYLRADSLWKQDSITWRRQEDDGMRNSYFLFNHGNHYDLAVYRLETTEFVSVASFLK